MTFTFRRTENSREEGTTTEKGSKEGTREVETGTGEIEGDTAIIGGEEEIMEIVS